MSKPALCFEYPLRPDFHVQLVLPQDLTVKDVARLCGFLTALIIEPTPTSAETKGEEIEKS